MSHQSLTCLIDGDGLLYRAGFSVEYTLYTLTNGTDVEETKRKRRVKSLQSIGYTLESMERILEPIENAIHNINSLVADILTRQPYTEYRFYLSSSPTWRHSEYPQYKANRNTKPIYLPELIRHVSVKFGAIDKPLFEADDLVAIAATELDDLDKDFIIVGVDKDLLTIPGTHYNPRTCEYMEVDPMTAYQNFYSQVLTGDTVDNVIGIGGLGPKTANKLLRECDTDADMWEVVQNVYGDRDPNVSEDAIILRAKILHLLRSKDDEWSPPKQ